jgi:hypothetical protein
MVTVARYLAEKLLVRLKTNEQTNIDLKIQVTLDGSNFDLSKVLDLSK